MTQNVKKGDLKKRPEYRVRNNTNTVSYTHLDVYKRQHTVCLEPLNYIRYLACDITYVCYTESKVAILSRMCGTISRTLSKLCNEEIPQIFLREWGTNFIILVGYI